MPRESCKRPATAIAILREAVEDWRRGNGWSRETVAQTIVEAHEQIDGPLITGIVFNPPTRDTIERMRVNADRIYRWLDDVSKDRNHLPANMMVSVLSALPAPQRRATADRLLRPCGLGARALLAETVNDLSTTVVNLLRADLVETAQANEAIARLIDGVDPGELETAQREIVEAMDTLQRSLAAVEAAMNRGIVK
ncbi:MAG: hypothetical protein WAO76_07395 [Georgfuchsia sp.]